MLATQAYFCKRYSGKNSFFAIFPCRPQHWMIRSKQTSISFTAPDLYTDAVYRLTTWRIKYARIV